MTLEMIWSDDHDEIKLNFYDPNDTARERRIIVSSLDALKHVTLDDLIPEKADLEEYFPERPLAGVFKSPEIESKPGSAFSVIKSKPSPALLYLLLKNDTFGSDSSAKDVENSINKIMTGDRWTDKDKKELLAAKSQIGVPGLFLALRHGHTEAVKPFLAAILSSNLSREDKKKLLAAKHQNDGLPGLLIALEMGHTKAVMTFVETIRSSNLAPEDKKELLAAKTQDDTPGFFIALQNGHTETVKGFIKAISSSKLSLIEKDKKELLAAKDQEGAPGVYMALKG